MKFTTAPGVQMCTCHMSRLSVDAALAMTPDHPPGLPGQILFGYYTHINFFFLVIDP